jgi:hypothetical protein
MKQLIEDLISAMEYHVEQTRPVHMTTVAIQAAKDALKAMPAAQPAPTVQEPVALPLRETEDMHDAVMSVIYQGVTRTNTDALWQAYRKVLTTTPPAAQPAPVQEPVAGKGKELSEQLKLCARNVAFVAAGRVDMSSEAMQEMFALIDHVCVGLDSPPAPQKPWVGLDEDEVEDCARGCANHAELAQAIEAKLKEKNT